MTNLKTTKIGLAALTIIFLLLYGYFSTIGKTNSLVFNPASQGFGNNQIALGNLGGFHLLKNIHYSDEQKFHRLIIETELNRSTASPEDIAIPYTMIKGSAVSDQPIGPSVYQIQIDLSDTQVVDIPQNRPLAIFEEAVSANPERPKLIQEVRVAETKDEEATIIILLTKKALFRATADNSGTLVLDILK